MDIYQGILRLAAEMGMTGLAESGEIRSYANPFPGFYQIYRRVQTDLGFWASLPPLEKPPVAPTAYLSHPRLFL
ncbi:MAG: hypothetical protein ACREDR_27140, partial [Blastocatellia bacterium]